MDVHVSLRNQVSASYDRTQPLPTSEEALAKQNEIINHIFRRVCRFFKKGNLLIWTGGRALILRPLLKRASRGHHLAEIPIVAQGSVSYATARKYKKGRTWKKIPEFRGCNRPRPMKNLHTGEPLFRQWSYYKPDEASEKTIDIGDSLLVLGHSRFITSKGFRGLNIYLLNVSKREQVALSLLPAVYMRESSNTHRTSNSWLPRFKTLSFFKRKA